MRGTKLIGGKTWGVEDSAKRAAGYAAVDACVAPDTIVGLGTGSTAYWAIRRVGERVAEGWPIQAVATSLETERLCRELSIPLLGLLEGPPLDVAIDGADEVAPDLALIKGGGGALFRERAVALTARRFVVVATENKLVPHLGAFPLPVEVVPFAVRYVRREIEALGIPTTLRQRGETPFVTDNGNQILDCRASRIDDPVDLDRRLRAIHGVVSTGLFVGLTDRVYVAGSNGVREIAR